MQFCLLWNLLHHSFTDIAKESYRVKPVRGIKCTTFTQYVFQWSSIVDQIKDDDLSVQNSTLRAYIQIINRHISQNNTVNVNVTVVMVPRNDNNSTNSSDWSEGVTAGEQVLTVGRGYDGWVELNVSEGVQELWPLMNNFSQVQVIIKAEVDCIRQKKVPFNFINPAEIPLEQENRRTRHLDIQPFLVVFADNEETRALLQEKESAVSGEADESHQSNYTYRDFGEMLTYEPDSAPKKRSTSDCSISSYIVNFHALGLRNVVAPIEVNISKCSGSCTHRDTINSLGTNHAKIMNSIYHTEQLAMQDEITATLPCCVPTKFDIVYLIMNTLDGTATGLKSHNDIAASECGCR